MHKIQIVDCQISTNNVDQYIAVMQVQIHAKLIKIKNRYMQQIHAKLIKNKNIRKNIL